MSVPPSTTDVLIIGAGPVGLATAASLTARGVDAVVVDKAAAGANTSRAAVIHARTLQALEELGVTDELVRRGLAVPRFTIRDGDDALLSVDFHGLPSPYPYTLMLPQDATEAVLAGRLDALGGRVHRSCEVVALDHGADGVTATLAGGDAIRAGFVIGADGMRSVVRETTGIGFTGDTYAQAFVLADVRMDWALDTREVMLFLAPAGVMVVAPLPEGRHRIVASVDEASERPDRDDVQALLDERGPRTPPARLRELVWSSRFRVHRRLADRYRHGRVFLAGDAAHVHSPAGGQGMNIGIQDGLALAARLAAVLRDGAPAASLERYEEERRPVAADVVAFTDRVTRVATVGNPALQHVRNAALRIADRVPAVHRAAALKLSGLAIDGTGVDAASRPSGPRLQAAA